MKKVLDITLLFLVILFINSCENPSAVSTANDNLQVITISGTKDINEDLIVDENTLLEIKAGSALYFSEDVRIKVAGKIRAEGTADNPIIFSTHDSLTYWRGIEIMGMEDVPDADKYWQWLEEGNKETEEEFFTFIDHGNVFEYCQFSHTAPVSKKFERKNKWKGTIEAYNTHIRVSHCTFSNIFHFGGVLTQRSLVIVNDCLFDDVSMHKAINSTDRAVGLFYNNTIIGHRACNARCADGIWTKKFTGMIANNYIESVADDGIDTDGSHVVIFNNTITGVFDDGIDIDNKGFCYVIDNTIDNVLENGILMSDGSEVIAVRNEIKNSQFGIALRDGAEVVTEQMNIHDNFHGVILYQNLPTAIDKTDFEAIKEKIAGMTKDEIFEEEYIDGIEGPDDLIKMLDIYYMDNGDYYLFNPQLFTKIKKLDPLKKVFKITGVTHLKQIENQNTMNHPLNSATKNGLFLSGANIVNNTHDVSTFHHYNMKMEGCTFTSEEIKKEIMDNCKCDENHRCEIIDKLNTTAVEINTKKLIKKIKSI